MKKLFIMIISFMIMIWTCSDPKSVVHKPAECQPGFLPCSDDPTECCEVICPSGYLLCGEDSTECCEVICPPGYFPCNEDSTECCNLECEPYYHQCDTNSSSCCPDVINYFPMSVGSSWLYKAYTYGESTGDWVDNQGMERWTITEISSDSNIIQIMTVFNGIRRQNNGFDSLKIVDFKSTITINLSDSTFIHTGCNNCTSIGYPAIYWASHQENEYPIRTYHPYEGDSIRVVASNDLSPTVIYTLDRNTGLTYYYYFYYFPGSGGSKTILELIEYNDGKTD